MRRLLIYLRKYRFPCILAPLFKMLEAFMDLLVPVFVADIIDNGIVTNNISYVLLCTCLLIGIALLSLLFSIVAQFFVARASTGFAADLRQALFDHIASLSHGQIEQMGADTLITRITSDVNQVQTGLNMSLRLLLRSPFIVFGSVVMAFMIDVKCALIFMVAVPLLFIVVAGIMYITIPLYKKAQNKLDSLTECCRENMTGVRVIRSFCAEKNSVDQFAEKNDSLTKLNLYIGKISALLNPGTFLLVNIATAFVIYCGAIQVGNGILQQGQVVALYSYMGQMIVELVKMSSLVVTINRACACAARTSDILEEEPDMFYPFESAVAIGKGEVEFTNVFFAYPDAGAEAVENISFKAHKGEMIGIIGGTGSGKTTLIHLLERYYDVTKGSISLDGNLIQDYSEEELVRRIVEVPQKTVLFSGTIRENLLLGNEHASDADLWEALSIAQAKEVVASKKGGLNYVLEQNGKNLSGGQRQRLAIARAVVCHPEILILDDAESALDFVTDKKLRDAICSLADCTVFLVSQRAGSIQYADRILVLEDGKLVGNGTHRQLMKDCRVYQEIYASQFPSSTDKVVRV